MSPLNRNKGGLTQFSSRPTGRKETKMFDKRILVPVVGMLLMTVFPLVVALRGQTTPSMARQAQEARLQDAKATFPRVDYSYEPASDPSRRAKGRKSRKFTTIDPNITEDGQTVIHVDWELGVKPLPVDKSTVIVLGTVVEAAAFLSDNKGDVYSQFKIQIERVFENKTDAKLEKGGCLFAERDGGIVRFPSGFEKWIFVRDQGMPTKGKRYLFFLNRDFPLIGPQDNALYILTAYELEDDVVKPLDSPGGETSPFLIFSGKKWQVLLEKLKKELKGAEHNDLNFRYRCPVCDPAIFASHFLAGKEFNRRTRK